MFYGKQKGLKQVSGSTTLISRETEIVGDIKFSGTLDIEGTVRGNIVSESGKDAVVRILDKGLVDGDIRVPSVMINGSIIGDVFSSKHLELASNAQVQGNLQYVQVEMAIGAEINGSLKHIDEYTDKADCKPQLVASLSETIDSARQKVD